MQPLRQEQNGFVRAASDDKPARHAPTNKQASMCKPEVTKRLDVWEGCHAPFRCTERPERTRKADRRGSQPCCGFQPLRWHETLEAFVARTRQSVSGGSYLRKFENAPRSSPAVLRAALSATIPNRCYVLDFAAQRSICNLPDVLLHFLLRTRQRLLGFDDISKLGGQFEVIAVDALANPFCGALEFTP